MIKRNVIMLLLITMTVCCNAASNLLVDKHSDIQIKHTTVQGEPKGASIQASVSGHTLSVVFTEDLGHVTVEVTAADNGAVVETTGLHTPNGACLHIPDAGSYVVTFTLPDGDIYYGEFEVTD